VRSDVEYNHLPYLGNTCTNTTKNYTICAIYFGEKPYNISNIDITL